MSSISSWFSDLSRRKLHIAASSRDGLRDTLNLRRFVLLKNSITNAEPPPPSQPHSSLPSTDHISARAPIVSEQCTMPDSNDGQSDSSNQDSEEKWLESVLENLDDYDYEVEVKSTQVGEELAFLAFDMDDPFESWMSPCVEYDEDDIDPLPFSFPSNHSSVQPPSRSPTSLQLLLSSPESPLIQPFIESRYPEADCNLPPSEASSDGESEDDDDDRPLTPYGDLQSSLNEPRGTPRPTLYIQPASYFLYPSEFDLTSPPPYFQQC